MAFNLELSQTTVDTGIVYIYGNEWAGQLFTTSGAFNAVRIELYLARESTALTTDPVVHIFSVSGGDPNVSLGSGTLDRTQLSTSPAWITVDFSSAIALSAATQYAIVIDPIANTATSEVLVYGAYPGSGGGYTVSSNDGGTWSPDARFNIGYKLYSPAAIQVTPTWQGTGSFTPIVGVSHTQDVAHIIQPPSSLIQPGWDSGNDAGSVTQWNKAKPQIVSTPIGSGDYEIVPLSQQDAAVRSGVAIYRGAETWWFEHTHLIPRVLQDLGNLVTDQQISGELYNADRTETVTVSSVTNNLGSGISIQGVPSTPFNLGPQTGIPFQILVSQVGDFQIDSSYTFHMSNGDDYVIYIEGSRIVMFPIRPEAPLHEHLIFDTRIIEAVDGSEQRIANRQYPRGMFEATYKSDRKFIEMLLFDRQSKIVAFPAWHEPAFLNGAHSSGVSSITVNTTDYANFFVGGYAVILQDKYTYDALKITGKTATTLTFESPLTNSYSSNTQVMPLLTSYIEASSASLKYPYNEQYFNLRIHIDPEINDIADDTGWSTYGTDVLLDDNNLIKGGQLAESLKTKVVVLDNLTGLRTQLSAWDHNKRTSKKGWKCNTRQELWELRKLLHFLKGRQVAFYIPTFSKDIVPNQQMLIGTFTLNMDYIGYSVNARERWPKQVVRVVLKNGTKLVRTILDSSQVSSSVEQLTFDAAWPATYQPDDVERIEFLENVRLDVDDITIVHYNALGLSECVAPITEVNN